MESLNKDIVSLIVAHTNFETTSSLERVCTTFFRVIKESTNAAKKLEEWNLAKKFKNIFCLNIPKINNLEKHFFAYNVWEFFEDGNSCGPQIEIRKNLWVKWLLEFSGHDVKITLHFNGEPLLESSVKNPLENLKCFDGYNVFAKKDSSELVATIGDTYFEFDLEKKCELIEPSNDPFEGKTFSRGDVHVLFNKSNRIIKIFGAEKPIALPESLNLLLQQLRASHPFLMYREGIYIKVWNTKTGDITEIPGKEVAAASIAIDGNKFCITTLEKTDSCFKFTLWKNGKIFLGEHVFPSKTCSTLNVALQTFIFQEDLFGIVDLNCDSISMILGFNISQLKFLWTYQVKKLADDSIEIHHDDSRLPEIHINSSITRVKKIIGNN